MVTQIFSLTFGNARATSAMLKEQRVLVCLTLRPLDQIQNLEEFIQVAWV